MLFVSRIYFNEFLLLLDVAWLNKVLLLLLLLLICNKNSQSTSHKISPEFHIENLCEWL